MFNYLNDGFDEFNVFRDVNSFSIFDNINPFDLYGFPAYTKSSEGIQVVSDEAFSPLALDESSGSSSSQSVCTPVAIDDSDSNRSSSSFFTSYVLSYSQTNIHTHLGFLLTRIPLVKGEGPQNLFAVLFQHVFV